VVFAFGHGHIGLSTGPITGKVVAEIVTGSPTSVPVAPFSPARF
jgi:D-amino-acid dehydrogenase